MSRRALSSQLAATAAAGLLALTTTMTAGPAYGAPVDSALAPATGSAPVALMAYGSDAAGNAAANAASDAAAAESSYSAFFSSLPSLPPLILGLNIPGVFDAFNNVTGFLPWDYGYGLTIGNAGGLGIEAWDPTNPMFSLVAESVGTTTGAWPGVASLVGVETLLGGFTNTESYANTFDPTGTTCLICDTFSLLGPGNTDLFSWTTDIPIGGLPQFELSTPLASFGPDLGNAFDYSSLANGLVSDPAALSSVTSDPALLVNDIINALSTNLAPSVSYDLSTLLTNLSADVSTTIPNLLAANLAADAATIIPTLLASLIP
jgi:hypothetical protein